ncbi:MAG: hypothetical protein AAGI30_06005 [Planctomycetota bacterium]
MEFTPARPTGLGRHLGLILICLFFVCSAGAQGGDAEEPAAALVAGGVGLTVPVEVPQLGLRLLAPPEATIQIDGNRPGNASLTLTGPEGGWTLRIAAVPTPDPRLEPRLAVDDLARAVESTSQAFDELDRPTGSAFSRELEEDGIEFDRRPAARIDLVGVLARLSQFVGLAVVRTDSAGLLAFRFDHPLESITDAQVTNAAALFEGLLASARFVDETERGDQRGIAIAAAEAFRLTLGDEDYERALLDEPVTFRIVQDAPGGIEREIGFQHLHMRLGQLGELQEDLPRHRWSREDREIGYLVTIRARLFRPVRADSVAGFFMSRDRLHEVGRVVTTTIQGEQRVTAVEEFFRRENRLTVRTRTTNRPPASLEATLPREGYLSRVEVYLMPRLVALQHPVDAPGFYDFGFYVYDSSQSAIVYRSDSFERDLPDWAQTTTPFEHAPTTVSTLSETGRVLRQVTATGQRIERIEPRELRRIYEQKGLPTGPLDRE